MDYQTMANQFAQQFGLDPRLFAAQINQESRWNPKAVSPVGAQGLGQVMPDTARQPGFGVAPLADPWDPESNLRFSAEYMSKMVNRYDGDINRALAAYNWGVGNADKWDGSLSSLPQETRDYITKINAGMTPEEAALSGAAAPQVSTQPLPPQAVGDQVQFSTRGISEEALAMLNADPQVISEGDMPPPPAPTNRRQTREAAPTSSAGEFWDGILNAVTPTGDPNQGTRGRAAEMEAARDPANAPIEDIVRRAESSIIAAESSQPSSPSASTAMTQEESDALYANSPVLSEVSTAQERWNPVPPRDQSRPSAMQQGALDQSNQEPDPQYAERGSWQDMIGLNAEGGGMLSRALGWDQYSQDQRDNRWLAIGQGLLSGDDWASGIGNAAGNLMGVNQQEQQMAMEAARMASASQPGFQRVGSAVDNRTGEVVGGVMFDPRSGYFRLDENGQRITLNDVTPLNNSDASGSRFVSPAQAAALRTSVQDGQSGLRAIDRMLESIDTYDTGVEGFVRDMGTRVKTFMNSTDLTEEQIQAALAQGEIQGLIGKVRVDVVGPGVMTEQDAMRVLMFLGGGLGNFTGGNPAVVKERLNILKEGILRSYNQNYDQYNQFTQIPGSPYLPMERYTPSAPASAPTQGGSTQISPEIEDILSLPQYQ